MSSRFVDVYDTRTGAKVPHQVPEDHLRLFPYLALTPSQKATTTDAQPSAPTPASDAVDPTPAPARPGTSKEK